MSDEIFSLWPQEGDQLFIEGDDWYYNALLHMFSQKKAKVGRAEARELDLYITGYKEGGDRLVQSIMENRSYLDVLVYPTVFLYRQYLELCLKRLIREGSLLLGISSKWGSVGFPTDHQSHNLLKLWDGECVGLLQSMGEEYDDLQLTAQDLAVVRDLLVQFVEQDPYSYAFRYPMDKRDAPSFPNLHVINVRNLAEVMAKIAVFLDGIAMAISVHWDFKQEMSQYEETYGEETGDFS